mgnify:FL=1
MAKLTYVKDGHHIYSVLVENRFGVLARVAQLFARRGFNIFSLAVSDTEDPAYSRMTIVVDAHDTPLEQVVKQMHKLIPVIKITEIGVGQGVERELALICVKATPALRGQITELVSIFDAKIIDVGSGELTVSMVGAPDQVDAFAELLKPFGIIETQRTGRIALKKLDARIDAHSTSKVN